MSSLSPRHTSAYGLCAVGLPQVKAAGLAVVFDLTAHTFYRVSREVFTSVQTGNYCGRLGGN